MVSVINYAVTVSVRFTDIANAITVAIGLVSVGEKWTVIAIVPDTVLVGVSALVWIVGESVVDIQDPIVVVIWIDTVGAAVAVVVG